MNERDYLTRDYREDEDVSEERNERGYPGCEQCDGQGEYYFADFDCNNGGYLLPCDLCLKRRIADLERQRDDLAAALRAIMKCADEDGLGRLAALEQIQEDVYLLAADALGRLEGDERE